MTTATITSKGQVTIPKDVRDALGVIAGDRIDFVPLDDGGFAIVPASLSLKSLKGVLPKRDRPVTLAEMESAIANEDKA